MNSSKTKLRPLNPLSQKRPSNQDTSLLKTADKKTFNRTATSRQQKNTETEAHFKKVKYVKSTNKPAKAIQLYDCEDLDEGPGIEEQAYFEKQLEKNIKTEGVQKKSSLPIPKNQIVLPKIEQLNQTKLVKDLEKEMDSEMSRMYEEEMEK